MPDPFFSRTEKLDAGVRSPLANGLGVLSGLGLQGLRPTLSDAPEGGCRFEEIASQLLDEKVHEQILFLFFFVLQMNDAHQFASIPYSELYRAIELTPLSLLILVFSFSLSHHRRGMTTLALTS